MAAMKNNPADNQPNNLLPKNTPDAGLGFERFLPWLLMVLFTVYFLFSQTGTQVPQEIRMVFTSR